MTGPFDPGTEKERLEWEFELPGQGAFNWILSGTALLSAADLSYERYLAADRLERSLAHRDAAGMPRVVERPLSSSEVELLRDGNLGPVAIMLLGFGLENLSKGLLIAGSPTLVSGDRGIDQQLKSHRFEELVAACDHISHDDERRALQFISQHVIWAGRYPIPNRAVAPGQAAQNRGRWARHQLAPIEWLWEQGTAVRRRLGDKVRAEFPHVVI
ncbi:MAG: hypothetical protein ACREOQ_14615 [Gemmatimonadales bacterium]